MSTRRIFLKSSSALAIGNLLFPNALIAAPAKEIGLQLYTLREEIEKDLKGTLKKVAEIGYKNIESASGSKGHYHGMKPVEFKRLLKDMGLVLRGTHVLNDTKYIPGAINRTASPEFATLSDGLQKLVDNAAEAGQKYLICAYLFPAERGNLDDYKRLATLFNKAGEACKKAGLSFGYHNHDFEFMVMDDEIPYDILLKETDPNLVKMEMDLYWIAYAGKDPVKYFRENPGRFPLWHIKDMAKTDRSFTEVGTGGINFSRIFNEAKTAGLEYYFVEQDKISGAPIDSIKTSYDNLQKMKV